MTDETQWYWLRTDKLMMGWDDDPVNTVTAGPDGLPGTISTDFPLPPDGDPR